MDPAGRIIWANRRAHELSGAPPWALLGRSYLEFCPPDTHARLLDLHRRKLAGETVRFDFAVAGLRLTVTSGPVEAGGRTYFYSVARPAGRRTAGDAECIGRLAAAEPLPGSVERVDLNACLVGALKDEARRLKGRLDLVPGSPPPVRVRVWPLRMLLRELLVQSLPPAGRLQVATGATRGRAWLRISSMSSKLPATGVLGVCRRVLKEHGGRLFRRGTTLTLRFPAA